MQPPLQFPWDNKIPFHDNQDIALYQDSKANLLSVDVENFRLRDTLLRFDVLLLLILQDYLFPVLLTEDAERTCDILQW